MREGHYITIKKKKNGKNNRAVNIFFQHQNHLKFGILHIWQREAVKSNQQIKINHEKTINFAKGLNEEVAIKLIDGRPTIETQF